MRISDWSSDVCSSDLDLIKARRANPTDDIASLIANARVDDKLLPDWDVASQYIAILTAGHDTTSSSTAGGVAALAAAPDQFTMMKNDRDRKSTRLNSSH